MTTETTKTPEQLRQEAEALIAQAQRRNEKYAASQRTNALYASNQQLAIQVREARGSFYGVQVDASSEVGNAVKLTVNLTLNLDGEKAIAFINGLKALVEQSK